MTENKKEIKKIFSYYKNKYGLKTKVIIYKKKNINSCFRSYHLEENNYNLLKSHICINLNDTIFTLLHEIGHAINCHKNPKKFMQKWLKLEQKYYQNSFNSNYNKCKLEIKANKFAEKELKKWI